MKFVVVNFPLGSSTGKYSHFLIQKIRESRVWVTDGQLLKNVVSEANLLDYKFKEKLCSEMGIKLLIW